MKTLLIPAFAAALIMGAVTTATACPGKVAQNQAEKSYALVDVDQLAAWIDSAKSKVFHAASAETYAVGHIPSSVNVEYASLTPAQLGEDKDARMTFYCANDACSASKKAATKALELGYTNIYVYKGGVEGWKSSGRELATVTAKKKVRADG